LTMPFDHAIGYLVIGTLALILIFSVRGIFK
jgi:hypothetical protein